MKILFMGTPEFSVPSLRKLHRSSHELIGVVTVPDKPVGRGLKVRYSPVKQAALDFDLTFTQPEDLSSRDFIQELKKLNADLFVVVAFRILPREVFEIPPQGTLNLHSSLLPKYRGAAPINWAIINGEKETGVTTIFIEEKVDAGNMILQRKVEIGDDETAGELHDKLANVGADILLETVDLVETGQAPRKHQEGEVTKAPKLTRDLGRIQWEKSNHDIRNLIRGLAPTPGAYTFLNGKFLKFYGSTIFKNSTLSGKPGEVLQANSKTGKLVVATGEGNLEILEVQPEGKRRMSSHDFLKGYPIKAGDRFE